MSFVSTVKMMVLARVNCSVKLGTWLNEIDDKVIQAALVLSRIYTESIALPSFSPTYIENWQSPFKAPVKSIVSGVLAM